MTNASALDDSRIDVFDNVFETLLGDCDLDGVVDLSQRLAPVGNAPPRLIRRLAVDDRIAVAGPVLSQSVRLSSEDLHAIALEKGNEHLLAISERPGLTEPITDVLIERGNRDVARRVAKNGTARLSRAGLERLVTLAERDDVLSAGLSVRQDIPPDRLQALLTAAAARAEDKLKAVAAAQRLVLAMKQAGKLGDPEILGFAQGNRYEETVAALALAADLKYDAIENLMLSAESGGLILVCKALGLSWATTSHVLTLAADRVGVPCHDLARAQVDFVKLSKSTAERIMRFWHVRQIVS
ncbi:MAG TPA: DUF2336 domain-containing protein [Pseudolabrys sp.]|nr:DUF2336 domain-containing protein [Pseudolabrys sp.]